MKEQRAAEDRVIEEQIRMDWLVKDEEKKAAIKIAAKNSHKAKKAAEASKAEGHTTPEDSSTSAGTSDADPE